MKQRFFVMALCGALLVPPIIHHLRTTTSRSAQNEQRSCGIFGERRTGGHIPLRRCAETGDLPRLRTRRKLQ